MTNSPCHHNQAMHTRIAIIRIAPCIQELHTAFLTVNGRHTENRYVLDRDAFIIDLPCTCDNDHDNTPATATTTTWSSPIRAMPEPHNEHKSCVDHQPTHLTQHLSLDLTSETTYSPASPPPDNYTNTQSQRGPTANIPTSPGDFYETLAENDSEDTTSDSEDYIIID